MGESLDGCKYAMIFVEDFSRHVEIIPMKSTKSSDGVNALTLYLQKYHRDKIQDIYTDGGPEFQSEFTQYCHQHGIRHVQSPPHHPNSEWLIRMAHQMRALMSGSKEALPLQMRAS